MAKKVTDTKVLGAVAKHFDKFHESENFGEILNNFTSICELIEIQPTHFVNFFPDLKVTCKLIWTNFCLQIIPDQFLLPNHWHELNVVGGVKIISSWWCKYFK